MPNEHRSAGQGLGSRVRASLLIGLGIGVAASLGALGLQAITDVAGFWPWLLVTSVAPICAVVGFVAVRLQRDVEQPVSALAAASKAAAAGDFSHPASEVGADELRDIALAVNRLARELRAERHRARQLEKLADAGRIAAGIAHEIGNPLTAIGNSIDRLRSRMLPAAEYRSVLDQMDREVTRAGRMANGLIDVSRPRALVALKLDINDAVRGVMRLLTDQGQLHRHHGVLVLDPSGPHVLGSRHDLEQVLVNLLLNAVDATPPDGRVVVTTTRLPRAKLEQGIVRRDSDPPLTIKPRREVPSVRAWLGRVRPPAECVSIVVADSGSGIPRADWERVFEPFFTTKAPGRGTGLGLAVVHSLVESLGGTIWVDRAREGGAAFHLLFPIAVASTLSESEPAPARAVSGD